MFDKKIANNHLKLLPGNFDYNQVSILKLAIKATGKLEKLNGLMYLIPNKNILIGPMLVKESVESSAIENIHTTTQKVLQAQAIGGKSISGNEKEVLSYHDAILLGLEKLKKEGGLGYNSFLEIQEIIEPNKPGVRKIPGTIIADGDGNAIYTPPEGKNTIDDLLTNLEKWMNNSDDDIDALIKMPVLHYQFESIHPFYDGNGRTGRILNILYLILAKKLDFPILFLSEYINKNRNKYYALLSQTHTESNYLNFITFLLEGIIEQATITSKRILKIKNLMEKTEQKIECINMDYHKITNLFFSEPFISMKTYQVKMGITEVTATRNVKKWKRITLFQPSRLGGIN